MRFPYNRPSGSPASHDPEDHAGGGGTHGGCKPPRHMQGLRAEGAEDEPLPLLRKAHPLQEAG